MARKFDWVDVIINTVVICFLAFVAGCGSGVGAIVVSEEDKVAKAYEICGQQPYATDYNIGVVLRLANEAKQFGATDLELLEATTRGCKQMEDQSEQQQTCYDCGIAIVDAVFWNF